MSSCPRIEGLGSSSIYLRPSVTSSLGTSLCQVTVGRPSLTTSGRKSLGCCVGGRPFNLVYLPRIFFSLVCFSFGSSILTLCIFLCSYFTIKDHPKLEGRFEEHICAAVEYASTIDDFDDLEDPRTLARHYSGPEPSPYVLHAICCEEKSKLF